MVMGVGGAINGKRSEPGELVNVRGHGSAAPRVPTNRVPTTGMTAETAWENHLEISAVQSWQVLP